MGEHKYSVLDMAAGSTNSQQQHTSSTVDPLLASAEQREPTIELVEATPFTEDIPNLVTTNEVTSSDIESNNNNNNPKLASSIATGVVGCLLGGPLLGLALGFGAAYAHDRPGAVGDASRAVGDLALLASIRAKEINEQHQVAEKTKLATAQMLQKAKDCDREHKVVDQAQNALVRGWNWTVRFVQKHNLIERGVQNVGKAVVWAAETLAAKIAKIADEHDEPRVHEAEAIPVPDEATKQ